MCTHPLTGIRTWNPETGGVKIRFSGQVHPDPLKRNESIVTIPCGQCMECRLAYARNWTIRIIHECCLHKRNSFITLTYNNDNLPENGTLVKKHVQDFMKNLRIKLQRRFGVDIRFYCAGEYGSQTYRPHYHLIIFGWDFPDRRQCGKSKKGCRYYRSPLLEETWQYGFSSVGDVSFNSAAYVSKYVTKKLNGVYEDFVYDGIEKEFALMSRRPGIGHDFIMKYPDDVYNYDAVEFKGFKTRPPVYYDNILAKVDPFRYVKIKEDRAVKGIDYKQKIHDRFFSGDDPFDYLEYERYLRDREIVAVDSVNKSKEVDSI